MADRAVFLPSGGRFVATELSRGPWDASAQHGGAPAALLVRAFERLPASDGLAIARLTYELLRPAPVGEVEVDAEVIRPGRRVQLLEGAMRDADGNDVVRARALRVRAAETKGGDPDPPPTGPEHGREHEPGGEGFVPPYSPMFAPDAVEIRFVSGVFGHGPATAWFRMRVPIVAGEEPTPFQRLAAAGDFGNGISAILSWRDNVFINPDLTLYVDRPPEGDWIGLESRTIIPRGGVGISESVVYDTRGRVGRAIQALLVARR